jgi:hypothetical protein
MKKKNKKTEVAVVPEAPISEVDKELLKIKEETEKKKIVISEAKKTLDEYKKLRAELELEEQQLKNKLNPPKLEEMEEEVPEEEPEPLNPPEVETDTKQEKFAQLLEQFNQSNEGFVEIYRLRENGLRTKIGRYPIKDVGNDLDFVARKFGGGDYLIVLKDNKGHFQGQINESYDEVAYPKPNNNSSNNPVVINTQQNDSLAQIVQLMEKSFQQQLETQKAMTAQLLEITKASVSSSPIKSLKDLVEMKSLLQDKDNNPLKNIETLMGLFTKGMEFGSTINQSNSGSDDSFLGLIKDLVPMVIAQKKASNVEEAKKYIQSAIKPTAENVALPNPPTQLIEQNKEVVPNEQPIQEIKEDNMKLSMAGNLILNLYKGEILKLAQAKHNPDEVADMILIKLPQDYYGIALDIAKNTERFNLVCQYIPELKDHKEWVEAVLESGKKILVDYYKSIDEELKTEKKKSQTKKEEK